MAKSDVTLEIGQFQKRLEGYRSRINPKRLVSVVVIASETILTTAIEITPIEFGTLRSSGSVKYEGDNRSVKGVISFGGPAAGYALYVHERLDVHHDIGQAKFLEDAFDVKKEFVEKLFAGILKG